MNFEWAGIAVTGLAGIIWAVRQEGRINALEQRHEDFKTDMHADVAEIKKDIKDIRDLLIGLLGGRRDQ